MKFSTDFDELKIHYFCFIIIIIIIAICKFNSLHFVLRPALLMFLNMSHFIASQLNSRDVYTHRPCSIWIEFSDWENHENNNSIFWICTLESGIQYPAIFDKLYRPIQHTNGYA
jgi:hypothetical protein